MGAVSDGPKIPALEAAEAFGTEHGADIEARKALAALIAGEGDAAKHLERLFSAVSTLAGVEGGVRHVSPDAAREYEALVSRVRQAIVHHLTSSQTALKRARTYLEERIIRQAERCGTEPTDAVVDGAAADVIALTSLDVFSSWLVAPLEQHRPELVACIRAAAMRGVKDGKWRSPGRPSGDDGVAEGGAERRAYEDAMRAMLNAIGIPYVGPESRNPQRSRAKKRGE
jgi:hypothetical protein